MRTLIQLQRWSGGSETWIKPFLTARAETFGLPPPLQPSRLWHSLLRRVSGSALFWATETYQRRRRRAWNPEAPLSIFSLQFAPHTFLLPKKQCSFFFWKSWTKYEGWSVWHGCVLCDPRVLPPRTRPSREFPSLAVLFQSGPPAVIQSFLKPRREFNAIFLFIYEPQ
jgi:hypothetical protein